MNGWLQSRRTLLSAGVLLAAFGVSARPALAQIGFEAESLAVTSNGATTSVQNDTKTSGGHWLALDAKAAGPWYEFTLPNIPAGTYSLRMSYKTNNNRGRLVASVDGTSIGGTV